MNSKKITILVVEDEMPLLKAISSKLEAAGFEVATARSVQQAENTLLDISLVDAIWTDHYLLGNETGLDFVKWLRGQEKFKNIPIFVVSVTSSPDNVESYSSYGISKFYIKHEYRIDDIIKDMKTRLAI